MSDSDQETTADESVIPRAAVFSSLVKAAADYYKTIVTVASSFLGGTLIFLEKIAVNPSFGSTVLLGIGWLLLVLSILAILLVERWNLESGRQALRDSYDRALKIDASTRFLSWAAILLLGSGIACIMFFGWINLPPTNHG